MLRNLTKNTNISNDVKNAESLMDRTFGMLLGGNSGGLFFKSRFGLHTFFMNGPIDILVLDNNLKVVKTKENLLPNRIFLWNPTFENVIEMPAGLIKKSKTEIGDRIMFSPK